VVGEEGVSPRTTCGRKKVGPGNPNERGRALLQQEEGGGGGVCLWEGEDGCRGCAVYGGDKGGMETQRGWFSNCKFIKKSLLSKEKKWGKGVPGKKRLFTGRNCTEERALLKGKSLPKQSRQESTFLRRRGERGNSRIGKGEEESGGEACTTKKGTSPGGIRLGTWTQLFWNRCFQKKKKKWGWEKKGLSA